MFCGTCGMELHEGARFCASCGSPVDAWQEQAQVQPQQPQGNGQPYASSRTNIVASALLGVLLGIAIMVVSVFALRSWSQSSQVAVVVPIEVPGLDEEGTRIPVKAVPADSEDDSEVVYGFVGSDGSGLSLRRGTWDVTAIGSPISSEGVIYDVPTTVVHIVLDDEAIESGKTEETTSPLTFEPIDVTALTDEQMDELVSSAEEFARVDDERDTGLVDEVVQVAYDSREEGLEGQSDAASEQAKPSDEKPTVEVTSDEKPRQEEQERETEDLEQYTLHGSMFDLVLPEAWRNNANITTEVADDRVFVKYKGYMLVESQVGSGSYYGPTENVTLDDGSIMVVYPHLDDFGAVGIFGNAEASIAYAVFNFEENYSYYGTDKMSESDIQAMRELQAAACGLDASADSTELAKGTLAACANNTTFH